MRADTTGLKRKRRAHARLFLFSPLFSLLAFSLFSLGLHHLKPLRYILIRRSRGFSLSLHLCGYGPFYVCTDRLARRVSRGAYALIVGLFYL
nr:MAG TPA: hypothetical protein [Caudoviricetes sp.]